MNALSYARRHTRKEMILNTALSKTLLHTGTGCPSISNPAKVTSHLNLGISITNPSCLAGHWAARRQEHPTAILHTPLTDQGPKPQPNQPWVCSMAGNDLKEETIHSTLELASQESSLGGPVVTLLPVSHRLKLPKTDSPTSVSQIRPITSSAHNTKMPRSSTWNFLIPLNAGALHAHTHPQMVRALTLTQLWLCPISCSTTPVQDLWAILPSPWDHFSQETREWVPQTTPGEWAFHSICWEAPGLFWQILAPQQRLQQRTDRSIREGFLRNQPDPENPTGAPEKKQNPPSCKQLAQVRTIGCLCLFIYPKGLWLRAGVSA